MKDNVAIKKANINTICSDSSFRCLCIEYFNKSTGTTMYYCRVDCATALSQK